jgi:hypothetical protein
MLCKFATKWRVLATTALKCFVNLRQNRECLLRVLCIAIEDDGTRSEGVVVDGTFFEDYPTRVMRFMKHPSLQELLGHTVAAKNTTN